MRGDIKNLHQMRGDIKNLHQMRGDIKNLHQIRGDIKNLHQMRGDINNLHQMRGDINILHQMRGISDCVCTELKINRRTTQVGTFKFSVFMHVALRMFIMQVLASQLHKNRGAC